jgi:N6-adenosine-specific RNA methylase IME4
MKIAGYEVHPAAELFPLLDEVGLQRLAEDIRQHGQRVPVVLLDGKILDGRNRALACKKIGVEPKVVHAAGGNPWRAVWSLNAERRQIEDKLRLAMIGTRMVEGSDAWAAKQDRAKAETHSKQSEAKRGNKNAAKNKAPSREGELKPRDRSNSQAARIAEEIGQGVSRATVERALELERKSPEIASKVLSGEVQGNKALAQVKLEAKRDLADEIRKAPPPPPSGPFGVVVLDPPWRYDLRLEDPSHRGKVTYPDMSIEEIAALPVPRLAEPDCVLWLWTTNTFMEEACQLVRGWGFEKKTILTWDKVNLGVGDYLRNVTEHCILAVRGRPLLDLRAQTTLITEKRREHSRKPEVFYALVESLCPGSKLEMFAREVRPGWQAWGAETDKFTGAA